MGGTPGHCGHLMLHPGWTQALCQPGPPVHGHLGLVTYGDDTSSRCTVDHSSYVGSLHGRSFHNSGHHPGPEGACQSSTPGSCLLPHAIWDPRDFQAWGLLGCTQKSPGKFWKHRGQSQEGHQGPPQDALEALVQALQASRKIPGPRGHPRPLPRAPPHRPRPETQLNWLQGLPVPPSAAALPSIPQLDTLPPSSCPGPPHPGLPASSNMLVCPPGMGSLCSLRSASPPLVPPPLPSLLQTRL